MTNTEYAFSAAELSVGYNGEALIRDIQFGLHRGEILTLIGPNGAGKSTILKSLTRHLEPIAGTVYIGKQRIGDMSYHALAQNLSVVLTERVRPEMMSCYDVVAAGRYPYTSHFGGLTQRDKEIVWNSLARVRAAELADRDFAQISDGQRQRIMLARAICQEPEIIVLDEPTSFLDIRHKIELLDILIEMAREKSIAVIMSLHEIDLAAKVSDIIMCVKGDRIAYTGRPEDVFTERRISDLYDLDQGSYNVLFGSVELNRPQGIPQTFVLCGAGHGIATFRALQKRQTPFYAGILHENDLDYAVAKMLATQTFAQSPFTPISPRLYSQAKTALDACAQLIHTGVPILDFNRPNAQLIEHAKQRGIKIVMVEG